MAFLVRGHRARRPARHEWLPPAFLIEGTLERGLLAIGCLVVHIAPP